MTPPEIILWQAIRRDRLGYRVNRQKPFGPYYLDFYIKILMVAIEVDGNIHQAQEQHDEERDKWLQSKGITVIRVHARHIYSNVSDVVEMLEARLSEIANSDSKS